MIQNEDAEEAVRLMKTHISFLADEITESWNQITIDESQQV